MTAADPHADAALVRSGEAAPRARLGIVALHGRGADAASILDLVAALGLPDIAAIAPAAAGNSWWPVSFLAPHGQLEPWLTSALAAVDRAVAALEADHIPRERIAVLGFSQGACLAAEWAARRGGPVHSVWALSGALVGTGDAPGPAEEALYGHAPKSFAGYEGLPGVPVYLGCHERDPHIPLARVEASAHVFTDLGAEVARDTFPGAGHGVTEEEVARLRGALNNPA